MNVMEKLTEAISILDEVDEYATNLADRLLELEGKQQDLLHYIENNKISIFWCYRMIKEIKTIRMERRKVKTDIEIISRFESLKNKMISKDNRSFILPELHKKERQLMECGYNNRRYTEEELEKILCGKKDDV